MTRSISSIIEEIRKKEVGIQSIIVTDAIRFARNATGSLTYAGTNYTRKHVNTIDDDDEVIVTGNKQTNLSAVERTLLALAGKGEVEIRLLNGERIIGEVTEQELTYDLEFNSDTDSMHTGFRESVEYCKQYIDMWNGTNHSYFEDFKGGTVSIRCNETEEVVYEEEVR